MSQDYGMNDAALQNRKFAKTCVEKKRRDRINRCLDELKDLMSQADDKAKYQKMEKAEILEMAVTYMKNLRSSNTQQQPTQQQTDQSNIQCYSLAFRQCLTEFQNYLTLFPGIKDDFKAKIMQYMTQRYMENINKQSANKTSQIKRTQSNRYQPYASSKQQDISVLTNEQSNSSFSSSYLYNSEAKFGGSCSSLDGYFQKQSQQDLNQDSHNESLRSTNSDNLMSPALSSPCSSPVANQIDSNKFNMSSSSSSPISYYSNYDDFMKVWRPW